MRESEYQTKLKKKIERRLPGCIVLKNDSGLRQGIPDLIVLAGHHWAALEVKISEDAAVQPNQIYYIEVCNQMSFAAFIYPENEEIVLHAMEQTLLFGR